MRVFVRYINPDACEHRLVEIAPHTIGDGSVEIPCLLHEFEHECNVAAHLFGIGVGVSDKPFCIGDLGGDLLLPRANIRSIKRPIKVSIDQSLFFDLQHLEPFFLCIAELARLGGFSSQEPVGFFAYSHNLALRELNVSVPLLLHRLFNMLNLHIWEVTVCAPGVSSETEEVGIHSAAALGVTVSHPSITATAYEHAFEVMVVFPGSITGKPSPRQESLDLVPSIIIDKGFMRTVIDHASVTNLANVVRV